MAEPRDRPILFSGSMVRAILGGRKTQTRRLLKPQPAPNTPHDGGTSWMWNEKEGLWVPHGTVGHLSLEHKRGIRCPYGVPGDRLWVRETWRAARSLDALSPEGMAKACTEVGYQHPWAPIIFEADGERWNFDRGDEPGKVRVSIHMPRWASRLTLEVTGIRVERLQDISEEDARAEGIDHAFAFTEGLITRASDTRPAAVRWFHALWENINGSDSWDANPWVWVIEFRQVEVSHG